MAACEALAGVTRGPDLMLTIGSDFQFSNAHLQCVMQQRCPPGSVHGARRGQGDGPQPHQCDARCSCHVHTSPARPHASPPPKPAHRFKNLDKLIHYVNADGRVNALYSTPAA